MVPRNVGAGADVAGADGVEQAFDPADGRFDEARRLAGFDLALQLEQSLVGQADPPRQDRRDKEERRRVAHQKRRVGDMKFRIFQRAHVGAMGLIEQRRELAQDRAGLGHRGDLGAALLDDDRAAFEDQKPPGLGALDEHGFAGAVTRQRQRGQASFPGRGIVDRRHSKPLIATSPPRGPLKNYTADEPMGNALRPAPIPSS